MSTAHARPFRFSVQAFEAASGAEWLATARRAEELGYATLFTTDHYFGPGAIADESGHRPVDLAPSALIAAAAATTTLRVGCRVFCVDYHHPVVLAKEMATIDLLSDGRLEVGLGAGWVAAEYEGLGVPMERPGVRIERLSEAVGCMRRTGAASRSTSRHTRAGPGFAGRPMPVQKPGPPILIGGGAPRVLRPGRQLADIVSINFNNAAGKLGSNSVDSSNARSDGREDRLDPRGGRRAVRRARAGDRRVLRRGRRDSASRSTPWPAVRRAARRSARAPARADRLGGPDVRAAAATARAIRRQLHHRRAALMEEFARSSPGSPAP